RSRYQTAARLAADLRRCRAGGPTRWPVVTALASLPIMLGIAGFALWPGNNPDKPPQAAKLPESWFKATAALPAEDQARAVADMLRQLNPGFNGVVKPTIADGAVEGFEFITDHVSDIRPVRALTRLKSLACVGTYTSQSNGILSDLSALDGIGLTKLEVYYNESLVDLSPITKMPLRHFHCGRTGVVDLSPLGGMPLEFLICGATRISTLAPLKGMKIRELRCNHTLVTDLSPLEGMPLEELRCHDMPISSLAPLRGMPLVGLECHRTDVADLEPLRGIQSFFALNIISTRVRDLSPLKDTPGIKWLWCDFDASRDAAVLREVKSLERINNQPAEEFLKRQGN
ncbi:MAG: leucine-rich repeat domain-containing protein, partial [Planctomycetota bacterium]